MNANRMFYVLVGLALGAVILFTFREAVSTAAIAQADHSYDQVEQVRLGLPSGGLQADRTYDPVEVLRLGRASASADQSYSQVETLRSERGLPMVDRSYDAIENLRASRGTK